MKEYKMKLHEMGLYKRRYKYLPLSEEKEEIRLITLHPAGSTSIKTPVRISLDIVSFPSSFGSGDHVPEYEALSYAWGSPKAAALVTIISPDGEESDLPITQSLAEALPYLRYPDKPRTIWIDAIAVNQKDPDERSSQVKRMADIYKRKNRVLIWLGCGHYDTDVALKCLQDIDSKAKFNWSSRKVNTVRGEEKWADRSTRLDLQDKEVSALLNIFNAGWFDRLWIWQEVRMASTTPLVCIRDKTIPWSTLGSVGLVLWIKPPHPSMHGTQLYSRLNSIYYLLGPSILQTLPDLVQWTQQCKCSDPRDRIFALLSMLQNPAAVGIEADYNKTLKEVYQDAFVRWSGVTQSLNMLEFCSYARRLPYGPSWVPNLDIPNKCEPFDVTTAAWGTRGEFQLAEGDILEVLGIHISTVKDVAPTDYSLETEDDIIDAVGRLLQWLVQHCETQIRHERIEALSRVITGGRCANTYYPPREDLVPGRKEIIKILSDIHHGISLDRRHTTQRSVAWVKGFLAGRTLFISKDGRLSLGPQEIRKGDVAAVFLGKRQTPSIIRAQHDGNYEIIGDAYCDGFMARESLLGPLPDGWNQVWVYDSKGYDRPRLVHAGTVFHYTNDPRLGRLPQGWTRESNGDEYFFKHDSEDIQDRWQDPRLLPEHLRERGVPLRVFRLS